LYEEDSDKTILMASFQEPRTTFNYTKLGQLEITRDGKLTMDVVVITAMIVQARSDEEKEAVHLDKISTTLTGIRNYRGVRGKSVLMRPPKDMKVYRVKR
jgi:hypothetical protein